MKRLVLVALALALSACGGAKAGAADDAVPETVVRSKDYGRRSLSDLQAEIDAIDRWEKRHTVLIDPTDVDARVDFLRCLDRGGADGLRRSGATGELMFLRETCAAEVNKGRDREDW
jgi:ABC-type glycerol-3-phosphate transport system substrate-binding protein